MKAACKFPKRQPQHQWYNNNEQKKKGETFAHWLHIWD